MNGLALTLRLVLGGVFVTSGWQKLMAPLEEFKAVIHQYAFLPEVLVPAVTWAVPWIELIFGTFLVVGFLTRVSAFALASFSTGFIAVLARSLWLGLDISECGCFGTALALAPREAILLDGGLLAVALYLIRQGAGPISLDRRLHS